MTQVDSTKAAARAWLSHQQRAGRSAARPVLVWHVIGTLLGVGQAFLAASILASVFAAPGFHAPGFDAFALAGFAGLAVLRAGVSWLSERAAFAAGAAARRRLRTDALSRLLHAGPALLRGQHSADLAAIVVDRIEALDGLFARYVPATTFAMVGPCVVLSAVLYADPWAALVLLGCGLLVPIGMAIAGIGAATASRSQFIAMTRLQARFLDRVRGIATIVLYGRGGDEERSLAAAAAELRVRTMRVLRVAFLSSVVLDLAAALAMVVLAIHYFSALRLDGSATDLWPALAVLLLTPEFFAPLRIFSAAYQDKLHATGSAEALLDLPPPAQPEPERKIRTVNAQGVTIAFDRVRLIWDAARGPALDDLSFRVAAGETLVLAGPSGSGKSSVIEILLGFVRPDAGRVTINGADITDLVPQALSRLTAWIGQRPILFAGSIRDNILFARPEATEEEVAAAARSARLDPFIATLRQGLDTAIGEGGHGLSGGQAQRVAIARAYLKNAPVLLLDEPTAHLDPATEQEVLDSLKRLTLGRTVILASHSSAAHGFGGRRVDLRDGRMVTATRGAA